jgi:hypothetical protein
MSNPQDWNDNTEATPPFDWSSRKQVGETQTINIPDGRVMHRKLFKDKNGQLMGEDSFEFTLYAKPVDSPRLFPHPTCQDCNGSGDLDGSACNCLSPDPHESVCPKCGSVMGMMCPGEWRCFKC